MRPLGEPLGERALLRREVPERLVAVAPVPELPARGDDLERRARGDERLLQPLELGRAEHRLLRHRRIAVRVAVEAVVEQEEVDVAQGRHAEHARHARQPVGGVRPVALERLQRRALHRERAVGVVRAEVVVVPDREVRARAREPAQLRHRAVRTVAGAHALERGPLRLAEVDVVAEPEHEIGRARRDRVEDPVVAAPGRARPAEPVVEVGARAERDREVRRLGAVLPKRLRGERPGLAGRAAVDETPGSDSASRARVR